MNNDGSDIKSGAPRKGGGAMFPPPGRGIGARRVTTAVEEPTMRSVAMMGPPVGGANVPGIGKLPPGIARPPSLLKRSGLPSKKIGFPSPASGLGRAGESENVGSAAIPGVRASNWRVDASCLEALPDDFPLERSSRIVDGDDASVIAARISDCLLRLSIEAEFDGEKAKAKCRTPDFVTFRIRLFSAGDEKRDSVIVELQRRSGSAFSFSKCCRTILDAAEGNGGKDAAVDRPPPFMKRPVGQMSCLKEVMAEEKRKAERQINKAVIEAADLLRRDRRDQHLLGLQSLLSLTDPLKTVPGTALLASKSVVHDESSEIRDSITLLLQEGAMPAEDPSFDDGSEEGGPDPNEELRNVALCILSNALSTTSKDGCLAEAVQQRQWFTDSLIPILVEDIKRARSRPHDACLAVRCLNCLMSCSSLARELAIDLGALEALRAANEFGNSNHTALANETELGVSTLKRT